MFRYLLYFAALWSCGVFGQPEGSSRCGRTDNRCLSSLGQELYLDAFKSAENELDPMFQKVIAADGPTFKLKLADSTVKGFKSCEIKETSISLDKLSIQTIMFCPWFEMTGQYEADGTLASMPFHGRGPYHISSTDYDVILEMKLDTTIRDGKKYTKAIDFNVDGDLKGDLELKLDNFYEGNKELSDKFHTFIKENPKQVARILQAPVFRANIGRLVESFNKNLENMTIDGFIA